MLGEPWAWWPGQGSAPACSSDPGWFLTPPLPDWGLTVVFPSFSPLSFFVVLIWISSSH